MLASKASVASCFDCDCMVTELPRDLYGTIRPGERAKFAKHPLLVDEQHWHQGMAPPERLVVSATTRRPKATMPRIMVDTALISGVTPNLI
jgi:hypothetical protein